MTERLCACGCGATLTDERRDEARYATPACRTKHYRERRETARVTSQRTPQWLTVLHLLRQAGPIGVHTFELRRRYIGNPSQRIAEIEARGHRVSSHRERLHGDAVGSRYRLTFDAEAPAGTATPTGIAGQPEEPPQPGGGLGIETGQLFVPSTSRPSSPYDEAA